MMNMMRQSGAALIISMVILLILTMLGVTAMNTATTQDLLSANLQESVISDDCVESVLRDIQTDLINDNATVGGGPVNINSSAGLQSIDRNAANYACADNVAATFEYAGRRIVPGTITPCYSVVYEVNATISLNTGTQRSMTFGLARNPASCI